MYYCEDSSLTFLSKLLLRSLCYALIRLILPMFLLCISNVYLSFKIYWSQSSSPGTASQIQNSNYSSSLAKMAYIHCKTVDTFSFLSVLGLLVKLSNGSRDQVSNSHSNKTRTQTLQLHKLQIVLLQIKDLN